MSTLTLYTFAMSHYSEKIRWTLDAIGADYREAFLSPVFHIGPALGLGRRGRTTLPVLRTPEGAVQDSTRILLWLEHEGLLGPLLPSAQRERVLAVEDRFDAIGKDVARLLYAASFGVADDHIVKLWTDHATPLQSRVIRGGYPLIRWAFRRKLGITASGARRAQQRIARVVDWLEAQLKDGRTYLVGDHLTVADITAASLLAPLACPPQHAVYGEPAYRQGMAAALAPWAGRPAMKWLLDLYEAHRGTLPAGAVRQAA